MSKKIIPHTLRTITLEYDDTKQESEFEKELLEKYLDLHTKVEAQRNDLARMYFEYTEMDDRILYCLKAFKPINETLGNFLKEAEAIAKANISDNLELLRDLDERMSDYHDNITLFHDNIFKVVIEEYSKLWDEYLKLMKDDDDMTEVFEQYFEFRRPLFEEYDKWSLDLGSYDKDEQELLGENPKFTDFLKLHSEVDMNYETLHLTVKEGYALWDEARKTISEAYDKENLLDCSQSLSYAQGTGDPKKSPLYLLPPGSPQVTAFSTQYGMIANSYYRTLTISVPMDVVKSGDVHTIQEIVLSLQHYPKLIEKWIFSIDVQFLNRNDIPMQDLDWKGVSFPMLWFNTMLKLPCTIFFIKDPDARSYILMGDILASNHGLETTDTAIRLEGDVLEELCNRLFNACFAFLLYCHNTGFDPQIYIEALLADFDLPITYEQVHSHYLDAIAKGIRVEASPRKLGEEDALD